MIKRNYELEIKLLFDSTHAGKLLLLEHGPFAWNARPLVRCLECYREWYSRIDSLLTGTGCKSCAGTRNFSRYRETAKYAHNMRERSICYRKTDSEYRSQVSHAHGDNVTVIGVYVGIRNLLAHRCAVHNLVFMQLPELILARVRCKECTRERRSKAKIKPINMRLQNDAAYIAFRVEVTRVTNLVYRQYYYKLNPANLKRNYREYHLDHIYSVAEAYCNPEKLVQPITLLELCHPCNLMLIERRINQCKQSKCGVTCTELRRRIVIWNRKYGNPFKVYRGLVGVKI